MSHWQGLIHRCIKGDRKAQKTLYESFAPRMLGVCMRYASDKAEAEDFLQEGFIKVFNNLKTLRDTDQLDSWIQKIMVTTALMHLRKHRLVLVEGDEEEEDLPEPWEDESVTDALTREELLLLIQELPTGFRAVFNLHAIEGYSQKEISKTLNITLGTVKSQYARAKRLLQQQVRTIDPELVKHLD